MRWPAEIYSRSRENHIVRYNDIVQPGVYAVSHRADGVPVPSGTYLILFPAHSKGMASVCIRPDSMGKQMVESCGGEWEELNPFMQPVDCGAVALYVTQPNRIQA